MTILCAVKNYLVARLVYHMKPNKKLTKNKLMSMLRLVQIIHKSSPRV